YGSLTVLRSLLRLMKVVKKPAQVAAGIQEGIQLIYLLRSDLLQLFLKCKNSRFQFPDSFLQNRSGRGLVLWGTIVMESFLDRLGFTERLGDQLATTPLLLAEHLSIERMTKPHFRMRHDVFPSDWYL